eukprot:361219-Chlamydomonas_euryale.AAC.2
MDLAGCLSARTRAGKRGRARAGQRGHARAGQRGARALESGGAHWTEGTSGRSETSGWATSAQAGAKSRQATSEPGAHLWEEQARQPKRRRLPCVQPVGQHVDAPPEVGDPRRERFKRRVRCTLPCVRNLRNSVGEGRLAVAAAVAAKAPEKGPFSGTVLATLRHRPSSLSGRKTSIPQPLTPVHL